MDFNGKVAVVTGSALGIGRGTAIELAKQGADIAGIDILVDENQDVIKEVQNLGRKGLALQCDISDMNQVLSTMDKIIKTFGRIDILINNASVFNFTSTVGADFDKTIELFDKCMNVNARGMYMCTLYAVKVMLEQGGGSIINVITNHVKRERYRPGVLEQGYDASKWAQLSLNETLAIELKPHGIMVNAICPAATDTPMLREFLRDAGYGDLTPSQLVAQKKCITTLMTVEDVATAIINIINWGPNGPVGEAPLVVTRDDCLGLAKY